MADLRRVEGLLYLIRNAKLIKTTNPAGLPESNSSMELLWML
jgi:hypothetical protein